jgi:hypothetical protein
MSRCREETIYESNMDAKGRANVKTKKKQIIIMSSYDVRGRSLAIQGCFRRSAAEGLMLWLSSNVS